MLKFDGYKSEPLPLSKGLDQGCPLSGIAFQFYNSDLVDIRDPTSSEDAIAFMDNTLLLAQGKSLDETNYQVKHMMTREGRGLDWSHMHQCKFALKSFRIMGLKRRREPDPSRRLKTIPVHRPIFLQGVKFLVVGMYKFLGVMLDQELQWKEHCQYVMQKGVKWVMQYQRLTRVMKGASAKYMRWFFYISGHPEDAVCS